MANIEERNKEQKHQRLTLKKERKNKKGVQTTEQAKAWLESNPTEVL